MTQTEWRGYLKSEKTCADTVGVRDCRRCGMTRAERTIALRAASLVALYLVALAAIEMLRGCV